MGVWIRGFNQEYLNDEGLTNYYIINRNRLVLGGDAFRDVVGQLPWGS